MDDKELRNLKEEIKMELLPVIARQVYIDLRAEEIQAWLWNNLRDTFCLTPALPGYHYFSEIVYEMLRGTKKEDAILLVAKKHQKTPDSIKFQLRKSIAVGNERIDQIQDLDNERWKRLKYKSLPSQPKLIRIIFEECVSALKLRC